MLGVWEPLTIGLLSVGIAMAVVELGVTFLQMAIRAGGPDGDDL